MNSKDGIRRIPELLAAGSSTQVASGHSSAEVFRIEGTGWVWFLKVRPWEEELTFDYEVDVLRWLSGKLPVPEVLEHAVDNGREYLLTTAIPGEETTELVGVVDSDRIVAVLAEGLRQQWR